MMREPLHDIRITRVEDPQVLWRRREEWNGLVERSATNTVFQTLEWQLSWWRAFGADAQALILVAEVAGQMVGIAPLVVSVQPIFGRKRRVVHFLGGEAADYCDFIVEPAQSEPVVSRMLQWLDGHRGQWDVLRLLNLAEGSPLRELLPHAFGRDVTDLEALHPCPTRIFRDPAGDQRLLRKRDITQKLNQLRARGEVSFRRFETAREIEENLEGFFRQHVDRWTGTDTPSMFNDERQRRLYRELALLLAPRGWVLFSAVMFNGTPVAFHFGYEYGGRMYVVLQTFNPEFRRYGPGMLQIRFLLEHAMARGAKELDFTVGDEPYKFRFANHARMNYAARVHPRWMFYGADRVLLGAKALARRAPALGNLGRRLVKPLLGGTP